MSEFNWTWKQRSEVALEDRETPVRQVYTWIITSDQFAVIVSKDGEKWQLPGGALDACESLVDTAVREAREESGVELTEHKDKIFCFGYYVINEPGSNPERYLQVRMMTELPFPNNALYLDASNENLLQLAEELIRHVAAVRFTGLFLGCPKPVNLSI